MGMQQDVLRGCGHLVAGGTYIECPLAPGGAPLEAFLLDPPIWQVQVPDEDEPVGVQEALGLEPKGVRMVEMGGVWHVVDWVGSSHYPNVTDFLEEVRRYGLCRRAEGVRHDLLTPASRHIIAHAGGWLHAHPEYGEAEGDLRAAAAERDNPHPIVCPEHLPHHGPAHPPAMCVRYWWQDVRHGEPVPGAGMARLTMRTMPSFTYTGAAPPAREGERALALVASFPIANIMVVEDHEGGVHEDKLAGLAGTSLPVRLHELGGA